MRDQATIERLKSTAGYVHGLKDKSKKGSGSLSRAATRKTVAGSSGRTPKARGSSHSLATDFPLPDYDSGPNPRPNPHEPEAWATQTAMEQRKEPERECNNERSKPRLSVTTGQGLSLEPGIGDITRLQSKMGDLENGMKELTLRNAVTMKRLGDIKRLLTTLTQVVLRDSTSSQEDEDVTSHGKRAHAKLGHDNSLLEDMQNYSCSYDASLPESDI